MFVFHRWADQPSYPADAQEFLQSWQDGHEVLERTDSLDRFDVTIHVLVSRQIPEGFPISDVRDDIHREVL